MHRCPNVTTLTLSQIYVWDLKDPSKPYSPGTRSSKLDEITALAWNRQVQHVLASSSSTGYTVVWDLRGKREVVALTYGGGGSGFGGPGQGGRSAGGRRGMSDVAWHPDNVSKTCMPKFPCVDFPPGNSSGHIVGG